MLKRRKQYMTKVEGAEKINYIDMVFVVGDCTANLKDGTAAAIVNDPESEKILKLVLNKQKSVQNHLKYIAAKGSNGFDAVSCMFAVHYFFQTEEKLNGFLMNVSTNLKKGGIFFCTFMDGKSVVEAIHNNGGDIIEGRKVLGNSKGKGIPLWSIIRRYDIDEDIEYNKKVDVLIEATKKFIPEFIVNFDVLVKKCKEYNLELQESELFSQHFNRIKSEIPADDNEKTNLHKIIMKLDEDDELKTFSFFNRWCIFKKL
jgi:hypothetical protein